MMVAILATVKSSLEKAHLGLPRGGERLASKRFPEVERNSEDALLWASPMALENMQSSWRFRPITTRGLMSGILLAAIGWGSVLYAANQSVQGLKKEESGFDGDAPTAILIEAGSGSVLSEKNADELR